MGHPIYMCMVSYYGKSWCKHYSLWVPILDGVLKGLVEDG
jgi:hypothetical protein